MDKTITGKKIATGGYFSRADGISFERLIDICNAEREENLIIMQDGWCATIDDTPETAPNIPLGKIVGEIDITKNPFLTQEVDKSVTYGIKHETIRFNKDYFSDISKEDLYDYYCEVFDELRKYDCEENVITLPCSVGDTVYEPNRGGFISKYYITSIIITSGSINYKSELISGVYIKSSEFNVNDIGKTIFLTQEEALAEMED